uniref:Secreted peptide n=1 Tax=Anopheles braziliensis TaxID=58242 RepID=A0A2M3YX21_9DIPT
MKYFVALLLLGLLAFVSVAGAPVPEESKKETTTTVSSDTTDAAEGEKTGNGDPTEFLQNIIRNAMESLPPYLRGSVQMNGLQL